MVNCLRLNRPLTFVDVETTGVDPGRDRVIEIALVRLAPGTRPRSLEVRLNPQRPIPPAASAIHGIRDEHVANCPTFAERAKRIAGFLGRSDLAGFGVSHFDLPFLVAEFERAGRPFPLRGRRVVDALTLFRRLEPRDLAATVRRYCGREHVHAHRACSAALASVAVLDAILGKHKDLPRTVDKLHGYLVPVDIEGWFRREGPVILFAQGKHRDHSLDEVTSREPSYLTWLADRVLPDARRLIEKSTRAAVVRRGV